MTCASSMRAVQQELMRRQTGGDLERAFKVQQAARRQRSEVGQADVGARVGAYKLRHLLERSRGNRHCRPGSAGAVPGAGAAASYHAMTNGLLAGELIRRVSGQSPSACVRDAIAGRLRPPSISACPRLWRCGWPSSFHPRSGRRAGVSRGGGPRHRQPDGRPAVAAHPRLAGGRGAGRQRPRLGARARANLRHHCEWRDESIATGNRTLRFRMKRPFPLLLDASAKSTANAAVIMPERLANRPLPAAAGNPRQRPVQDAGC